MRKRREEGCGGDTLFCIYIGKIIDEKCNLLSFLRKKFVI
jgi:hypothetical protein